MTGKDKRVKNLNRSLELESSRHDSVNRNQAAEVEFQGIRAEESNNRCVAVERSVARKLVKSVYDPCFGWVRRYAADQEQVRVAHVEFHRMFGSLSYLGVVKNEHVLPVPSDFVAGLVINESSYQAKVESMDEPTLDVEDLEVSHDAVLGSYSDVPSFSFMGIYPSFFEELQLWAHACSAATMVCSCIRGLVVGLPCLVVGSVGSTVLVVEDFLKYPVVFGGLSDCAVIFAELISLFGVAGLLSIGLIIFVRNFAASSTVRNLSKIGSSRMFESLDRAF
ncbi:hypothetical protein Bca4012_072376 [Brassica carinata]